LITSTTQLKSALLIFKVRNARSAKYSVPKARGGNGRRVGRVGRKRKEGKGTPT